jgi:hypothetical protein
LPVSNDILRGDLRVLYLAWLVMAHVEFEVLEDDEDLVGPPVPPNLHSLSPALENFAAFFDLDPDLIAAAAHLSPVVEPSDQALGAQLDCLPDDEKQSFLLRLLRGEAHLDVALAARLRELAGPDDRATSASAFDPPAPADARQIANNAGKKSASRPIERLVARKSPAGG